MPEQLIFSFRTVDRTDGSGYKQTGVIDFPITVRSAPTTYEDGLRILKEQRRRIKRFFRKVGLNAPPRMRGSRASYTRRNPDVTEWSSTHPEITVNGTPIGPTIREMLYKY